VEGVVANRNCPQKHIWRCRIVLLTADRLGRRRSCDSPWCGGSPERFIGRPAIPASPPPDEAGTFHQDVVQGWGKFKSAPDSRSNWMKNGGHVTCCSTRRARRWTSR